MVDFFTMMLKLGINNQMKILIIMTENWILSMQIFSTDKTVRSGTVQDLKELNNQSLATQAIKRRKSS